MTARRPARPRNAPTTPAANASQNDRPFPWSIQLTPEELQSLAFIGERYGYAEKLRDLWHETETPGLYRLHESEGWEFADAVDAEDGPFPLAGGELLRKLVDLWLAIRDERPASVNPRRKRNATPPANPRRFHARPEPINWDRKWRQLIDASMTLEAEAIDVAGRIKKAKREPSEGERTGQLQLAAIMARNAEAFAREIADEIPIMLAQLAQNPDDAKARLHVTEAAAHLKEAGSALANPCEYPATSYGPQLAEPEPNPRTLVEIGKARELIFGDRRYRWPVRDDWRVLVPAGAEQLGAGAGRIFLIPPPSSSAPEAPPEAGAARATFEEWHKFEPGKAFSADVPAVEDFAGTSAGKAASIVYRSHKWRRGRLDYEHQFSRRVPPDVLILGSVETPRAVMVRGGEFRVTSRGLVD